MVRANLTGINRVSKRLADGSVKIYFYHRATGLRLRGKPGSSSFIADYSAAEKLLHDRLSGTFNGLVRCYTLSPEFGKLAERTQREYRRMLTKAEIQFGDMPIAALDDPRVRHDFMIWRAKVAKTSGEREADNRLSVISAMLTWARENGEVLTNHIAGFRRLYHSDRSELIWLPEHIHAFMGVAPVKLQQVMIVALHTGQRQGDILRMTWSNYDGSLITIRQSKTGVRVEIPCTQVLREMLDDLDHDAAVILTTKTKRPWTARHFGAQWERASKAAGITDLHFHDLRGTANDARRGLLHCAANRRDNGSLPQDGLDNSGQVSRSNPRSRERGHESS